MTISTGAGSSQTLAFAGGPGATEHNGRLNSDGSVNSSSNPASTGDTITILVSGAGALIPTYRMGR